METDPEDHKCLYSAEAEKLCPALHAVADLAAKNAVKDMFSKFGYDIEKEGDLKRVMSLVLFIEQLSVNTNRGKLTILLTLLSLGVSGITALIFTNFTHPH